MINISSLEFGYHNNGFKLRMPELTIEKGEKIALIGYGGLTLGGMIIFKRCIIKTEYLILLVAFIFFGLSLHRRRTSSL